MKINTNKQNRDVHLTTADRLESSAFCVKDICRWFQVPKSVISAKKLSGPGGGSKVQPN